jgi:hypothetical protein
MKKRINSSFSIIFSAVVILLVLINAYSCCGSDCTQKESTDVPPEVLNKADSFIKSRTGNEFFNSYITPDLLQTKYTPPYYEMVYRLRIPDKPYVDELIKFTIDSTGNVLKNRDITGIPNCMAFPEECDFSINEENAIQIARENNLEEGIKDWNVEFIWNPQINRYVWHIRSTTQEMEGDFGYRGQGEEAIINPASGEVIAINKWRVN